MQIQDTCQNKFIILFFLSIMKCLIALQRIYNKVILSTFLNQILHHFYWLTQLCSVT